MAFYISIPSHSHPVNSHSFPFPFPNNRSIVTAQTILAYLRLRLCTACRWVYKQFEKSSRDARYQRSCHLGDQCTTI